MFGWMRMIAKTARRVGAVCVGAFLLAEAGLLNGRRATAHWRFGPELAKRFPYVTVESDRIWVRDGNVYTSAGIAAGIDLALAWVEEDCGNAVAAEVARELVLFLRRPGGQKQVSVSLGVQATEANVIQELQVWIAENLHRTLSVRMLAQRVAMSVRNFQRVFTRELGVSPAQYILLVRVESAQRQLERTDRGSDEVALASGFGSADSMRRAFMRTLGTTPRQYRSRVRSVG
jgi:transcriptional regulator GlxA family with amidase domain